MPLFCEITPELRGETERIRTDCGRFTSSHAFASIYDWSATFGLTICLESGGYAVKSADSLFFPLGTAEFVGKMTDFALSQGLKLVYASESDCDFLRGRYGEKVIISEDRASSEYVYRVQPLAELEGAHFKHIRKFINHIRNESEITSEPITPENLREILAITEKWLKIHCHGEDYGDVAALSRAAGAFELLKMEGVLLRENGIATAFVMGSPLGGGYADINFSKSDRDEDGFDYCCKHLFYQSCAGRYDFINHEEDLGLPGLRTRKTLLHPERMENMFTAVKA